jgi:drug/metabolite transporter (DMT)-like permease
MIQNLNFYDIYGYLLPGFTFLLLIWLPRAVSRPHMPSGEWSSAVIAVAVAYVVGHIMQMMAQNTLPSDAKNLLGRRRFPSDWILDADDPTFSQELKTRLWTRINDTFDIDVDVSTARSGFDNDSLAAIAKKRQDAFMLCRSALVRGKSVFYGEQLEGMYALMRGLTAAFGAAVIYHAGWILARWTHPDSDKWVTICFLVLLVVLIFVGLNLGKPKISGRRLVLIVLFGAGALSAESHLGWITAKWTWVAVAFGLTVAVMGALVSDVPRFDQLRLALSWLKAWPILFALLALGYSLGTETPLDRNQLGVLALIALLELFIAAKCYVSYKYFAQEFPKAIYRDFCVLEKNAPDE